MIKEITNIDMNRLCDDIKSVKLTFTKNVNSYLIFLHRLNDYVFEVDKINALKGSSVCYDDKRKRLIIVINDKDYIKKPNESLKVKLKKEKSDISNLLIQIVKEKRVRGWFHNMYYHDCEESHFFIKAKRLYQINKYLTGETKFFKKIVYNNFSSKSNSKYCELRIQQKKKHISQIRISKFNNDKKLHTIDGTPAKIVFDYKKGEKVKSEEYYFYGKKMTKKQYILNIVKYKLSKDPLI